MLRRILQSIRVAFCTFCMSLTCGVQSSTGQESAPSRPRGDALLLRAYQDCKDLHEKHAVFVRLRFYGPGASKEQALKGPLLNRVEDRFFVHLPEVIGSHSESWLGFRQQAGKGPVPEIPRVENPRFPEVNSSEFGELGKRVKISGFRDVMINELMAFHRNQWFAGVWDAENSAPNIVNITERMRSDENFSRSLNKQWKMFQVDAMALPFLEISCFVVHDACFDRIQKFFDAKSFAFDYEQAGDVIAVWQRDGGVLRVRFGAEFEFLPIELEYFQRDKKLGPLAPEDDPGELVFRTVTQWAESEEAKSLIRKTGRKGIRFVPSNITMERMSDTHKRSYNRMDVMTEWDFGFDSSIVTDATILNRAIRETTEPNPLIRLSEVLKARMDRRDAEISKSRLK